MGQLTVIASLAMVCMIFIVHTMPIRTGHLKMASPDAYAKLRHIRLHCSADLSMKAKRCSKARPLPPC
ncbi:hypothetical protein [Hydrogenophaga sp. OTU3427]|uniref:hypothetical protein n=1 Tax=Hydrogenophaga sp. OTU3427 TaxID=3043856 RepID=UPI00313CE4F8